MDQFNQLLQEIALTTYEVGSSWWVEITHVSINNFYVRPQAYITYLPALQARGERVDPYDINLEDIVIYKSKSQKHYVRGKILSKEGEVPNTTFKLFAVDIGCTEDSVPVRRMWRPNYECEIPPLATLCRLADHRPSSWLDAEISSQWRYTKGELARIFIVKNTPDCLVIELYNTFPEGISTRADLSAQYISRIHRRN